MSKTKPKGKPTPPRRLVEQTERAFRLLESGHAGEALPILEELDQAYPNNPDVLENLVNAYYDLDDLHHYEHALRRLSILEPNDPGIAFSLGGAFLVNQHYALALRAFKEYLRRWPRDEHAGQVSAEVVKLEEIMRQQAREVDLPESQALELFAQNDDLRYCLNHGEYMRGRQVAEKLLRRFPLFIPALNNLGQIYAAQDEIDKATQTAQQVLTMESDNIHALSNLARLCFLTGRPAEAQGYAEKLKRSQADAADRWTKIAEALTFLEDDQGVLDLYRQAEAAQELEPPHVDEFFYHLLAVAAWRLEKKTQARRFWEKALQINPNFDWARQNLEDANKNVKNRRGVWAHPFESWLLSRISGFFGRELPKLNQLKNKADLQAAFARSVQQKYPELFFLAPHLVERGDAKAAAFVGHMAAVTGHPALLAAARAYIFGSRGTFEERFETAQILSQADLLPSGPVRIWNEGEWRQVMMLNMEISPEPERTLRSRALQKLYEEAYAALRDEDGPLAQEILEKAVALAPDDPTLANNLAIAYKMQGQDDKAHQIMMDVHTRFPDYFFGIIAFASMEATAGRLDKAHELLNALMQRKRMHTSEFVALCRAQIQVWLADNKKDGARSWLDLWERVDPDEPDLAYFRLKVGSKHRPKTRRINPNDEPELDSLA